MKYYLRTERGNDDTSQNKCSSKKNSPPPLSSTILRQAQDDMINPIKKPAFQRVPNYSTVNY